MRDKNVTENNVNVKESNCRNNGYISKITTKDERHFVRLQRKDKRMINEFLVGKVII